MILTFQESEKIGERIQSKTREKSGNTILICVYCDRSIHGCFFFSPSSSSWEQNALFYSAISTHNFIKAQQHIHVHIPIYSMLFEFESEKQHQPQNLQELQNPIRPCTQSPSCLSISHCPFWRYPTSFLSYFHAYFRLHQV